MKIRAISALVAGVVATGLVAIAVGAEPEQAAKGEGKQATQPSHRVVACYFHRTQRCPTCQKIGSYIEEGIQAGYATEINDGRVAVTMVDFQDPKNESYTNYYQITGPTLVLMDVRDGKVTAWKPAPKVWSLVGKKDAFFQYVQGEVRSYLEAK
jgi:hypothetical protein